MGIRQSMRPRHQVLVLKCYPRVQKSTTDVKPNSSELSYLLYYASTRRSKLHKVGDFLENRTELDVRKARLGNVQVTLQIVTALIEKCPRDLPLYVSSILSMLSHLLHSGDVNFIEESVTTFNTLCQYLDMTALAADQDHGQLFDKLVSTYASFASKKAGKPGKNRATGTLESLRYRTAGLRALQGLVASEAFGADVKHLPLVVPAILENLYSEIPDYLQLLQHREGANEQFEKDLSLRRRQSISVHRNADIQRPADVNETDPAAASVTTADVDRRSNEEVGVLALKCLRHIFTAKNRSQLRTATTAALDFTTKHSLPIKKSKKLFTAARAPRSWATEFFELISLCVPVQDRFIILVTIMEALISSPIVEDDLPHQLAMVGISSWLLQSSINFIGLSVMDVMVALIQHTLLLLQLGGQGSSVFPHHQQDSGLQQSPRDGWLLTAHTNFWGQNSGPVTIEVVKEPSPLRKQLLEELKNCIGDIATHVYYSDQIGDMISALFDRLKPSSTLGPGSNISAIQDPSKAADDIADSANLQERVLTDGFFSFDTARLLALQAVKEILTVANSQRHDGSSVVGRNRVDVSVWEGTQWLLRDSESNVRQAYVDALLRWLQFEVDRKNFLQTPEPARASKGKKVERDQSESISFAKRVLTNASQKLDGDRKDQNSFFQLLTLAIYETALTYTASETDILLLHLLLVNLLQRFGVNFLRFGLPMMFRLQDEIQTLSDPIAIISLATLVQTFFCAVAQCFGFENSALGSEIYNEIARRTNNNLWLKSICLPPVPIEKIGEPEVMRAASFANQDASIRDSLHLFSQREELVTHIASGYAQTLLSPPTSPGTSPRKSFVRPHMRKLSTNTPLPLADRKLSTKIMVQMLEYWSRESCIAAAEWEITRATSAKSNSGSGQRSVPPPDGADANGSPVPGDVQGKVAEQTVPVGAPFATRRSHRHLSNKSSQAPFSDSSGRSIVHVEDLKRVLSGNFTGVLAKPAQPAEHVDDNVSDSMIAASITDSDSSLPPDKSRLGGVPTSQQTGPSSIHEAPFVTPLGTPTELIREADPLAYDIIPQDDDVPPVPMLPESLRAAYNSPPGTASSSQEPSKSAANVMTDSVASKASNFEARRSGSQTMPVKMDLQTLLNGLDTAAKRPPSLFGAPPY